MSDVRRKRLKNIFLLFSRKKKKTTTLKYFISDILHFQKTNHEKNYSILRFQFWYRRNL